MALSHFGIIIQAMHSRYILICTSANGRVVPLTIRARGLGISIVVDCF